jgi:hypothetical protein
MSWNSVSSISQHGFAPNLSSSTRRARAISRFGHCSKPLCSDFSFIIGNTRAKGRLEGARSKYCRSSPPLSVYRRLRHRNTYEHRLLTIVSRGELFYSFPNNSIRACLSTNPVKCHLEAATVSNRGLGRPVWFMVTCAEAFGPRSQTRSRCARIYLRLRR